MFTNIVTSLQRMIIKSLSSNANDHYKDMNKISLDNLDSSKDFEMFLEHIILM